VRDVDVRDVGAEIHQRVLGYHRLQPDLSYSEATLVFPQSVGSKDIARGRLNNHPYSPCPHRQGTNALTVIGTHIPANQTAPSLRTAPHPGLAET
jgi:hypothetical protein